MEQGWDPEVRKFFVKILNTISFGLIWMLSAATAGIYFKLAIIGAYPSYVTWIFYAILAITFILLIRYFFKTWRDQEV